MDGGLDQGTVGDGPGDRAGVFKGFAPLDVDRDEVGRSLAVVGDRAGEGFTRRAHHRRKNRDIVALQDRVGRRRARQQEDGVVGTGVPLDRQAIERMLDRIGEDIRQLVCPEGASVKRKPSIVAIRGPIMAAPLAIPSSVTSRPAIVWHRETILGRVSVVMIEAATV